MKVKKLAIAMGLLAMGINTSVSAETFNMFEPSASGVPSAGTTNGGTVVGAATYNANINGSIDKDSSLTLNLDAFGESVTMDVISVKSNGSSVSYSATSANMDVLNVAVSDGVMMGSLNYNGNVYKFKPAGNGDTLIVEMAEVSDSTLPPMASGSASGESLEGGAAEVAPGGTDDGSVIKVIVAYTPEFAAEAGDVSAYMALMESETNTSFSLSDVNTSVEIVHSYQTSYSDSTNFRRDADQFMNGLGAGQDLRTQRDSYEADIMVVMTGNMGYDSCGYSAGFNVQGHEENPNGSNALALVREGCGTGYYGFAHQLGFIFGADLNDGNSNMVGGGEAYAHGYCGSGFRTIMSYNCPGSTGGKRLPLWSNPDNPFNGNPTGNANANNVKVLNDRALEVSNFRFAVAPPTSPSVGSPAGEVVSRTAPPPTFTWTTEDPDHASSYMLKITDSQQVEHSFTVTPAQAGCSGAGTSCAYTLSVADGAALAIGIANWTVTAKNSSGEATSNNGITTIIDGPVVPGPVDLIAPEGVISDSTPTYTWNAEPGATWYQLWVGDNNSHVILQWYTTAEAGCESGAGVCSVIPDTAITQSPTTWWVRTWNEAGYGDWSAPKTFSVLP